MRLLPGKVQRRVWHVEPGFIQPDFVAEYSEQTGKYPVEFRIALDFMAHKLTTERPVEVLEIGSGPGWMAILLAKSHPLAHVMGIDLSPTFNEIAQENSRREGVAERCTFTLCDAESMTGIADHRFDAVMSHQSIQYWPTPELVFDQIDRVLKPDGVFCISADRRDMDWLGCVSYWLGRISLSRRISHSWSKSVAGCLTVAEARSVVERSQLRDRAQVVGTHRMLQVINCNTTPAGFS